MSDSTSIVVMGDWGLDVCAIDAQPADEESQRFAQQQPLIRVPSGREFIHLALNAVLCRENKQDKFTIECVPESPIERLSAQTATSEANSPETLRSMEASLPTNVVHLRPYRTGSDSFTWRVHRSTNHRPIEINREETRAEPVPSFSGAPILVVADCGGAFRQSRAAAATIQAIANSKVRKPGEIQVLVDLDGPLPELPPKRCPLWDALSSMKDRVCVLCSAPQLRHQGVALARHLSWELAVETLAAELRLHPLLAALSQFNHLIVRFGTTAAVHIQGGASDETRGTLVFSPDATAGTLRDIATEGDIVGYKSMIIAGLLRQIHAGKTRALRQLEIVTAVRTGLVAGAKMFEFGYQSADEAVELARDGGAAPADVSGGRKLLRDLFNKVADYVTSEYKEAPKQPRFGTVEIPQYLFQDRLSPAAQFGTSYRAESRWEILRDELNKSPVGIAASDPAKPSTNSLTHRVNVGMGIALFGLDAVLNREHGPGPISPPIAHVLRRSGIQTFRDLHDCITRGPDALPDVPDMPATKERDPDAQAKEQSNRNDVRPIYAPVLRFGKLTLLERDEIEGLLSIRNLMRSYLRRNSAAGVHDRPVSVAVFGTPGSGKSFAIKQIAEQFNANRRSRLRKLVPIEFNVAQFDSPADLATAAQQISNINHSGHLPLAFFDEFDCVLDGRILGWLRFFLAPMQDGYVYGPAGPVALGPAILVFAGGVFTTFLSMLSAPQENAYGLDENQFRTLKGPDFVSRLSGHVDITSIDRAAGQYKYVLRRAVLIRSLLLERGLSAREGKLEIAQIDPDVLYALLLVDRYKHGVRSLESVIRMCQPIDGRLEKASLPAVDQLGMHVSPQSFAVYVARSRAGGPWRLPSLGKAPTLPRAVESSEERRPEGPVSPATGRDGLPTVAAQAEPADIAPMPLTTEGTSEGQLASGAKALVNEPGSRQVTPEIPPQSSKYSLAGLLSGTYTKLKGLVPSLPSWLRHR